MAIGSWGPGLVFSVSDKKVLTFNDMSRTVASGLQYEKKAVFLKDSRFLVDCESETQPSVIASLGQTCAQLPQLMQTSGLIL